MLTLDKTNPYSKDHLSLDTGYVLKSMEFIKGGPKNTMFRVYQVAKYSKTCNDLLLYSNKSEDTPSGLAKEILKSQRVSAVGTKFYDKLSLDKPTWFPTIDLSRNGVIFQYEEMSHDEKKIFLETIISSLNQ